MIKKIFPLLFACTLLLSAQTTLAAGSAQLQLGASRTAVNVGEIFSVTASINSGGSAIDTARANISYPAHLLQASSVSLIGKLGNATPNNTIDNTAGTISWGGYGIQSPITGTQAFIRITFRPIAQGSATVTALGSSRLVSAGQEKNSGVLSTITIQIGSELPAGETDGLVVSSPSHPDQDIWYAKDLVQLTWTDVADSYLFRFDQEPDTTPTSTISATSKIFKRVRSGVHYFHLRGKQADGQLTATVHFAVRVDMLPPNAFSPYLRADEKGGLLLHFGTTDNHSGIERYELSQDGVKLGQFPSPYQLSTLAKGEHQLDVVAYDQAGNTRLGWVRFVINEDGSFREIAHSARGCQAGSFCLAALFTKPVIGGLILALILLLLLLFSRRQKKRRD